MKRIWKYKLKAERGIQKIKMPADTQILKMDLQDGAPIMWGMHDVEDEGVLLGIDFRIVFTGDSFAEYSFYVGSFQIEGLVYHVFKD